MGKEKTVVEVQKNAKIVKNEQSWLRKVIHQEDSLGILRFCMALNQFWDVFNTSKYGMEWKTNCGVVNKKMYFLFIK
jgi:hypothetical protein